jgi:hypothetical protein
MDTIILEKPLISSGRIKRILSTMELQDGLVIGIKQLNSMMTSITLELSGLYKFTKPFLKDGVSIQLSMLSNLLMSHKLIQSSINLKSST